MIIFEMEKEDIKYVDHIGELADMCIVIDNPKFVLAVSLILWFR